MKDWTTRQKVKNWTGFEGETGRTIGQNGGQANLTPAPPEGNLTSSPISEKREGEKGGQQAPRGAGRYCISIDQAGGSRVNTRWIGVTQFGRGETRRTARRAPLTPDFAPPLSHVNGAEGATTSARSFIPFSPRAAVSTRGTWE